MTLVYLSFAIVVALLIAIGWGRFVSIPRARKAGILPAAGQGTMEDVKRLMQKGRRDWAALVYRELTGADLKTAVAEVEKLKQESS